MFYYFTDLTQKKQLPMKNSKLKQVVTAVALGAIVLFTSNSCKKPTDGVDLIFNTDVTDATVSMQFINAKTGEAIGVDNSAQKVNVTIEGPNKSSVVDNAGGTNFKVANATMTVGVKKGMAPSASNPIKFHIVAHAAGYLSTSVSVRILEEGTQHMIVRMVEVGNEPKGVASAHDNSGTTDGSGTTTAPITVSTPLVDSDFEKTKAVVNIPAGTQLFDENMNPVTGTITTTLVYFNNQDEAALASFPGGFAVTTAEFGDIVFKTAGFIAMEMKNQSGTEVKNFGTPIQMTVEIPAATTNEKAESVTDGMIVPIWSYEPESGKWGKESEPAISMNSGTGKYEVTYDMIHLSYWNLDWHYAGSCYTGAKVTINSNVTSWMSGMLKLKYADGTIHSCRNVNLENGSSFDFMNAFPNTPMIIEASEQPVFCEGLNSTSAGSVNIADLCSGNYTLDLTGVQSNPIPVTINATCANKPGQVIKPTATIYARKSGACQYEYMGEMVNGVLKTSVLKEGQTYRFYVYLGGHHLEYDKDFLIDQTEYAYDQELPADLCGMFN